MTTQTQTPEERLSKLEGAYGQVNERFNDLTQAVREGDAALREEIRQGDANLRQVEANLGEQIRQVEANLRAEVKDEIRGVRTEIRTVLLLLGALWASMVGGFIALFLAM